MLCVDADKVPKDILQCAKSMVSNILNSKSDDLVMSLPRELDGGCPDFDPEDDFLTYGQIREGAFKNQTAVAKGSNKKIRLQGLALALLLSAYIDDPEVLSAYTDDNNVLLEMAKESYRAWEAAVFAVDG